MKGGLIGVAAHVSAYHPFGRFPVAKILWQRDNRLPSRNADDWPPCPFGAKPAPARSGGVVEFARASPRKLIAFALQAEGGDAELMLQLWGYVSGGEDEEAARQLDDFEEKWAGKYPSIPPAWRRAWPEVIAFLAFSAAI